MLEQRLFNLRTAISTLLEQRFQSPEPAGTLVSKFDRQLEHNFMFARYWSADIIPGTCTCPNEAEAKEPILGRVLLGVSQQQALVPRVQQDAPPTLRGD